MKQLQKKIETEFREDIKKIEHNKQLNILYVYLIDNFYKRHLRIIGFIEEELKDKWDLVINSFDYYEEDMEISSVKMVIRGE